MWLIEEDRFVCETFEKFFILRDFSWPFLQQFPLVDSLIISGFIKSGVTPDAASMPYAIKMLDNVIV